MKQFILVNSLVSSGEVTSLAKGAMGFIPKGSKTITTEPTELINAKEFNIAVGVGSDIQPYMLPVHTNKFSFVKSTYSAGVNKVMTVALPSTITKGVYTIIVVAKGAKFNERNKWSFDEYVPKDGAITATKLGEKFVKKINEAQSLPFKLVASGTTTITLSGKDYQDFDVKLADNLYNVVPTITTEFKLAINSPAQIEDLYNKCIADKGINYTYRDTSVDLYPNYPKSQVSEFTATGYDLYSIRFAEPRVVKTTDEVVNQVIHIAVPTGEVVNLETILKALSGESVDATSEVSAPVE